MTLDRIQRHDSGGAESGARVDAGDGLAKETDTTPATEGGNDATALSGFRLYAVAIGVSFGALMMSLDVSIIGTAIPSITSDFGGTSQIAWYPAAYTFATCVLTPVAGKMATSFPMKWVYLIFSFIFLVGSIVCAAAPSSNAFIAGRAIAGVGAAGVASNGLTILITIAPRGKKAVFMGMGAGSFGVGLIIAPILGGVFSQRASWRWCFWINLPLIAVTLTVVYLFLSAVPPLPGTSIIERILSLDLLGCGIFVPAIFMLLLAMNRGGQEDPWNSATVIGLFAGSGAMLLLFIAWENRRGIHAMIPRSVVLRRTIVCTTLFASCHMGALVIASYYLPYWFQGVQGTDPITSGIRILPTVLSQLLATIIGSGLSVRLNYYNPWFFLAGIFMCVANVLFTRFSAFDTSSSQWIGYQVLLGVGGGFGMQMPSLAVQLELSDTPELVPIGISLNMLLQYLGATVTQIIAGTIFNNELRRQLIGTVGLSAQQANLFIAGGIKDAHSTAEILFPELVKPVIEAYNTAITSTFYVAVASSALAFFLAFGIKWNKIGER